MSLKSKLEEEKNKIRNNMEEVKILMNARMYSPNETSGFKNFCKDSSFLKSIFKMHLKELKRKEKKLKKKNVQSVKDSFLQDSRFNCMDSNINNTTMDETQNLEDFSFFLQKISDSNENSKTKTISDFLNSNKFSFSKTSMILKKFEFEDVISSFNNLNVGELMSDLYNWNSSVKISDKYHLVQQTFGNYLADYVSIIKKYFNAKHGRDFSNFHNILLSREKNRVIEILSQDMQNNVLSHGFWCGNGESDNFAVENCADFSKYADKMQKVNLKLHERFKAEIEKEKERNFDRFLKILKDKQKKLKTNFVDLFVCPNFSKIELNINNKEISVNFREFFGLIFKEKEYQIFWENYGVNFENFELEF